jgi:hypothetical protein
MMQLALRIQEYLAFASQVLGELVWDDEVRSDAAGVRAHGRIGQGLQSLVRFRCCVRAGEQQHVVRGSAQSLKQPNGFTSRMKQERGVDGAVSGAWTGAEIMPAEKTGV